MPKQKCLIKFNRCAKAIYCPQTFWPAAQAKQTRRSQHSTCRQRKAHVALCLMWTTQPQQDKYSPKVGSSSCNNNNATGHGALNSLFLRIMSNVLNMINTTTWHEQTHDCETRPLLVGVSASAGMFFTICLINSLSKTRNKPYNFSWKEAMLCYQVVLSSSFLIDRLNTALVFCCPP